MREKEEQQQHAAEMIVYEKRLFAIDSLIFEGELFDFVNEELLASTLEAFS